MVQIHTTLEDQPTQILNLQMDDPGLDLNAARDMAKTEARALSKDAMLLSYHSEKTGEYWPTYHCGGGGRPPWVVFAESRGCNLIVDVNAGQFRFYYLKL
jgi:hypothetical protein